MSTRLYKINGEYNTFEYWHDHYGYTKTPTFSVQYKTTNPWGAAFASDGYYDAEDLMDIFTFSFFVPGVVGWYSIDDLALEGYYPAAATDLTVYREGVASNAASLVGNDGTYYLVERDINQGWMTEEEMFARGWEFITIDYTYLLIDETTGNSVLENFEQDFAVEPIAESIIPDDDFVVTPLTEFPVTTFYLNSEGNKATEDHYLTMTGNPVFDLDGNNILYDDYKDIQSVMPAYFSRVDNTFFMGQPGDTFVDWSEGKAGIGAVASRGKSAWSVSFERRDGVIDVYVKTNSTYPTQFRYQSKVTSTSTAAAEAGSLNEIYLDSAFTQPFQIDPNMDYELGSMANQEWTPNAVQTKKDMPSSTTSSTSTKVSAELLTESNGNFLIWFVTNYTSTSSISAPDGYAIRKLRVTPKPEIVLKVKWGDTVNVPSGYKVSEVRTFVGYANKSYYSSSDKFVTYEGKNKYFDNIEEHNLIIRSTNSAADSSWPLIVASQGRLLDSTAGPHMQVLDFGAGYKNSTSFWSFSDAQTNGTDAQAGDFSVLLKGKMTTNIINAINSGYPVRFLWFIIDGEGNAVWHKTPEAFRVPNSLWSFVNGVFSWLGNSEDTSSLAWYYKHDWELYEWEEFDGVWFYVHCLYDPTPDPPAPSFDSATGTISGLTLPTAHSGLYTNVTFDTLRYYVRGTTQRLESATGTFFGLSTAYTWYYGTINWTDDSLGDLSSLIQVNPTTSYYLVQQTIFRIIFITVGITGFHPYDTGDSSENLGQITAYSYNNGVHSITFYCTTNWWQYADIGRIQFRYLDGTTTFNGLDAYDLILVNNGVLSKATTTDRYYMYNTYNGDITIHAKY